jgi:hypothetical protein
MKDSFLMWVFCFMLGVLFTCYMFASGTFVVAK